MPEKPPLPPVPRAKTHPGDRDVYRPKTPPVGVVEQAAPVFVDEEFTDQYEGEELRVRRAKRPTPERVDRLERKHDELVKVVTEIRVEHGEALARVESKLEGLPDFAKLAAKMIDRAGDIEHLHETRKIDIDYKQKTDQIARGGDRRKWVLQALRIIGAALALATAAFAAGRC